IFAAWIQRQVLDTGEWVNTSNKLLDQSEIRDALSNYAVDQLYENVDVAKELKGVLPGDLKDLSGPASTGLRQLAVQGAEEVLGTARFQDAWEQANTAAHRTLIKVIEDEGQFVGTEEGNVTLRLRPLIIQLSDEVGLGGDVADKVPADVGNIKVLSSDELGLAQTIAKLINGIALATTILVFVLFGLAIYLSAGYRWVTVLGVGVGLIIAGLLVLILREVAGNVIVDQLAAPDVQPAAEQAWGVSTSLLKSISWSTIYYGAFFMIAAWLASPARSAFAVRRFIAPVLKEYPAVVGGVLGLIALIWVASGADSGRQLLLRLGLVAMAAAGVVALRRRAIEETPDATLGNLPERVREGVATAWSKRDRLIPSNDRSPSPPSDAEDRKLERLERIAALHERGVLTEEEMTAEKTAILEGRD
ncbi:MAG: hypothetical protein ACXWZM_06035, partial [Solirubrobacterales bacterium]